MSKTKAKLLLLILLCSCFGFAFQPVGQKYLPAETAAVFTAGELLSASKIVGYVLILLALLLYNSEGRFPWHAKQ